MKKIVDKMVTNSMFLLISSLSATFFSFLYWLMIGKFLLPEDFGVISTSINFSIFLSIISVFGFGFSIIKLLPEYLAKHQNQKVDSLLSYSFKFMLFSAFVIAILLAVFSKTASGFINLPQKAIFMSSALIVLITLATYFDSVLRGYQNMKWVAVMQITGQFSKLLLALLLVILGFGYTGPIFGFMALYFMIVFLSLRFVRIKINTQPVESKKVLFDYSIPAFISTLLSYVFFSGKFVILNAIKSSAATGVFSLANTITAPLILLPNVLMQAIFPVSSELATKKNTATLTKTISHFLRYTLLVTLPLAAFLAIFSKPLILTFSRPEYLGAMKLFPILAASSIIFSLGGIFYQTLYALGKTKIYRNVMIVSVIVFLLSSFPLTYKFSNFGMTIAVLIFSSLYAFLSYFYLQKLIKISIPYTSIGKLVVSTLVAIAALLWLDSINSGLIWAIISAVISGVIYIISIIATRFFEKTDINLFKDLVMKIPFLKRYFNIVINLLYKIV